MGCPRKKKSETDEEFQDRKNAFLRSLEKEKEEEEEDEGDDVSRRVDEQQERLVEWISTQGQIGEELDVGGLINRTGTVGFNRQLVDEVIHDRWLISGACIATKQTRSSRASKFKINYKHKLFKKFKIKTDSDQEDEEQEDDSNNEDKFDDDEEEAEDLPENKKQIKKWIKGESLTANEERAIDGGDYQPPDRKRKSSSSSSSSSSGQQKGKRKKREETDVGIWQNSHLPDTEQAGSDEDLGIKALNAKGKTQANFVSLSILFKHVHCRKRGD